VTRYQRHVRPPDQDARQQQGDVRDGQALVYIYHSHKLAAIGIFSNARTGDMEIVALENGGYYPYLVDAGSYVYPDLVSCPRNSFTS
jgi:hypothetical protein